jgi:GTP-binding protein EngB required for normal cell division
VTVDEVGADPGVEALTARAEGLTRLVILAEGVLPAERLAGAHALAKRAGDRLRLSGEHTVVALAGATGSGKSSLFNALARMELSAVGVRRPTTAYPFACVWGPDGAVPLLDWLAVAPQRRFSRESVLDGEDEAALRGLVLLDLPDFDSLATGHRAEVDRLLDLVDLVVWVTDPQKYADQVLHDRYLREFRQHGEVTVVVLNQADRLTPADAARCVADLAGLLAADGLPQVPVFAVSATAADPGSRQLRDVLERAVAARRAALNRLSADLDDVAADLADVVGDPVGPGALGEDQVALLADALAAASGVPAVAAALADRYQRLARHGLTRIWGGPRRDPVAEVLATEPGTGGDAALRTAVRGFVGPLAQRLPVPWATLLADTVRTASADLGTRLRTGIATAPVERPDAPLWRLLGLLRGLVLLGALGCAAWLVARLVGGRPGGLALPALLAGAGVVAWWLVGALSGPVIAARGRAVRRRAEIRLRLVVESLTREYLVVPARQVLARYAQAGDALHAVGRW